MPSQELRCCLTSHLWEWSLPFCELATSWEINGSKVCGLAVIGLGPLLVAGIWHPNLQVLKTELAVNWVIHIRWPLAVDTGHTIDSVPPHG